MIDRAIEPPDVAKGGEQEGLAQVAEGEPLKDPEDDIDYPAAGAGGTLAHQLIPHVLQGDVEGSAHDAEVVSRPESVPVGRAQQSGASPRKITNAN